MKKRIFAHYLFKIFQVVERNFLFDQERIRNETIDIQSKEKRERETEFFSAFFKISFAISEKKK